jgi:hypothetical protein
MSSNAWVVTSVDGNRSEVVGIFESEQQADSGRGTIWISPHIPLEFDFHGGRPPRINRAWLQALTTTAERGELHSVPEVEDPEPHANPGQTRL